MEKSLKLAAEKVADEYGFSSLQEAIRVMLTKLSRRELIVSIEEAPKEEYVEHLSPAAEKRYKKAVADIKAGRNIYKPKDTEEFFKLLRE
jgi:antitoxin component of RelBE/YafQ-DinJ toxin-antitoxin module